MEKDKIIQHISQFVQDELKDTPDYFLVEVKSSPSSQVTVFVDADHGASIDRLAGINRVLYRKIEEAGLFGTGGNFSLEVSSPGLDEPLKMERQYLKNIGRRVTLVLGDDSTKEGVLTEVNNDGLVLELSTGAKKDKRTEKTEILFNQIKLTKVCVVF